MFSFFFIFTSIFLLLCYCLIIMEYQLVLWICQSIWLITLVTFAGKGENCNKVFISFTNHWKGEIKWSYLLAFISWVYLTSTLLSCFTHAKIYLKLVRLFCHLKLKNYKFRTIFYWSCSSYSHYDIFKFHMHGIIRKCFNFYAATEIDM